jgi:hypothetical protein
MRLIDERPQNKHLIHDTETQRRRATRHGYYYEPWYTSYKSMMQRCNLKTAGNYYLYGERGVSVCKEWHDISKFAEWAKNSGYKRGLTLDRVDVNGDYNPQNCRWATPKQQANNRRNTLRYTYNGKTHTLTEWAEKFGINRFTLYTRLEERKWPIEKALLTRPNCGAHMIGGEDDE